MGNCTRSVRRYKYLVLDAPRISLSLVEGTYGKLYQECPDCRPEGLKDRGELLAIKEGYPRNIMDTRASTNSTKRKICTACIVVRIMHRSVRVWREDKRGGRGRQALTHTKVVAIPQPRWQATDDATLCCRTSSGPLDRINSACSCCIKHLLFLILGRSPLARLSP